MDDVVYLRLSRPDTDLVARASQPGPDDDEIHRLLKAQGVT